MLTLLCWDFHQGKASFQQSFSGTQKAGAVVEALAGKRGFLVEGKLGLHIRDIGAYGDLVDQLGSQPPKVVECWRAEAFVS